MAGYGVESMFTLDDKASRVLLNLIKNIEAADKALQSVQKMLTDTGVALFNVGTKGKMASDTFGMLFPALSKTNAQLTGMAGRMDTVATALTDTAKAGESLNVVVGDMVGQMERLSLAAKTAQTSVLGVGRGMGRSGGRMALGAEAAALGGRGLGVGGMFGGALNAALLGVIGYQGIRGAAGIAANYDQARRAMQAYNLTAQEMARVDAATEGVHKQIPQITLTQAMITARETYGAMGKGHLQDTLNILPTLAKSQVILSAFSGRPGSLSGIEHLGSTMVRGAEMLGIAQDPKKLSAFIEGMTRGIVAHGGLVSPSQVAMTLNYMRASRYGKNMQFLSSDFLYLLGQAAVGSGGGGGSKGVAPMFTALDALFFQGRLNKLQYANYVSSGLMKPFAPGQQINTTTIGMLAQTHLENIKGLERNPVEWILTTYTEHLAKFLHKSVSTIKGLDQETLRQAIQLYSPGLHKIESGAVATFMVERQQLLKGRELVKSAPGFDREYQMAAVTLKASAQEVSSAFDTLITHLSKMPSILDAASGGLETLTKLLTQTDDFVMSFTRQYPALTQVMKALMEITNYAGGFLLGTLEHFFEFLLNAGEGIMAILRMPPGQAVGSILTGNLPADAQQAFKRAGAALGSAPNIFKPSSVSPYMMPSGSQLVPPPPPITPGTNPLDIAATGMGPTANTSLASKMAALHKYQRAQLPIWHPGKTHEQRGPSDLVKPWNYQKPKETSMAPIQIIFNGAINDFEHFKNKLSDAMNRAQKIAMKQFAGSNAGQSPWTDPIATG